MPHSFPAAESAGAELVAALSANLEAVAQRNAAISSLIAQLPDRLHHWTIGEAGSAHAIPVEQWTGPGAGERAWLDLFLRRRQAGSVVREVCGIIPDPSRFRDSRAEQPEAFAAAIAAHERSRMILQDPTPATALEVLAPYLANGTEARAHRALPSWFWVDSDSTVALPAAWGDLHPTSVTLYRSPVMASAALHLFEQLWAESRTIRSSPREERWEPLLRLMYEGATMESASRKLGISSRTGRRRIDEAMAHYAAGSLFELGFAWGTDVSQTPAAGSARG